MSDPRDERIEALLRAGRAVIRAADDYADDGPYLRADMKGAALDAALAQLRAVLAGPLPEPASAQKGREREWCEAVLREQPNTVGERVALDYLRESLGVPSLSQGVPELSDEADAYNLAELIRAHDAIQAEVVSVPEPMRKAIAFGIHTIRGLMRSQGVPTLGDHSDDSPDNRKGHVVGGCPMCAPAAPASQGVPERERFIRALNLLQVAHGNWVWNRKSHEEARNEELADEAQKYEDEVLALYDAACATAPALSQGPGPTGPWRVMRVPGTEGRGWIVKSADQDVCLAPAHSDADERDWTEAEAIAVRDALNALVRAPSREEPRE